MNRENVNIKGSKPWLVLLPTLILSAFAAFLAVYAVPGWAGYLVGTLVFLGFLSSSSTIPVFALGVWRTYFYKADVHKEINLSSYGGGKMAIFIPCYEENLGEVLLRVTAMRADLAASGKNYQWGNNYCFFLSSDTQNVQKLREEESIFNAWSALSDNSTCMPCVQYMRRADNRGRKVGNLDNWLGIYSDEYEYVCVLDADSLVSAQWLLSAHAQMENDPNLGLLQSMLTTAGRGTAHARMAQFGSRLGGRIWSQGSAYWFGDNANYWGHNAVLRTKAFMKAAHLPRFEDGSTFLSHDIVEAALLRSQGWAVKLDPIQEGSWEETPTEARADAAREARWCRGNMQHFRIAFKCDLTLSSRIHLFTGILQYLTAPFLLLAFLISGASLRWGGGINWHWAFYLADFWLILNALPKIIGAIDCSLSKEKARGFGGITMLWLGTLASMFLNIVQTPLAIVCTSLMVVRVWINDKDIWHAQNREGSVYSSDDALTDSYKPSIAVALTVLWIGLSPFTALFMCLVSLATSFISSMLSEPQPTLSNKARLWDTVDTLDPSQPFKRYLEAREGKGLEEPLVNLELEKMLAD